MRQRSSAGPSSRGRPPDRYRPDTRRTPGAAHRASVEGPGLERHPPPARRQRRPQLVLQQSVRDQSLVPERIRRATILDQEMGEGNGRVGADHRSRRFSSSSARTSSSRATGGGVGGGPEAESVGGVSRPDRTASARKASVRTGLRVSLGGPSSATTRPQSVTRIVSPDAASRTYSLNRLFRSSMPTDLMCPSVAPGSYLINPHRATIVHDRYRERPAPELRAGFQEMDPQWPFTLHLPEGG